MKHRVFTRIISYLLSFSILFTMLNGVVVTPAAQATNAVRDSEIYEEETNPESLNDSNDSVDSQEEIISGVDENGFRYTSDGTSVTITGYSPSSTDAPFYGIEYNGHYYGIRQEGKSWENAQSDCQADGGYLATVNSADEQKAIEKLLIFSNLQLGSGEFWVGEYNVAAQENYADYSLMQAAVDAFSKLNPAYYDAAALADVQADVNAAIEEMKPENRLDATQQADVNARAAALLQKINSLQMLPADYDALQDAIEAAQATLNSAGDEYTAESKEALQKVINDARAVVAAQYDVSQQRLVDDAVEALNQALAGLTRKGADYAALDKVISDAQAALGKVDIADYTDESVQVLRDALAAAQDVSRELTVAEQQVISDVAYKLMQATSGLVLKPADVSELNELIEARTQEVADAKESGIYIEASITRLETALESAVAVANSGLTIKEQFKVDDAYNALSSIELVKQSTEVNARRSVYEEAGAGSPYESHDYIESYPLKGIYNWLSTADALDCWYICEWDEKPADDIFVEVSGDLVIPEKITGLPVTAVADNAFSSLFERIDIFSITLPDTVVSIGSYAFASCTKLTSVGLGNGLTSIGSNAFSNCESLTEIDLGDSLVTIEFCAFSDCTSLKEITFPASLTEAYAALDLSSIETVYFDEGLTSVPTGLFSAGYIAVKKVVLPQSLTEIGDRTFSYCTTLETVVLPHGLKTIGAYAFENCTNLKEITIPATLTEAENAFYNSSIETVYFADGFSVAPSSLFAGAAAIQKVVLPQSMTEISDSMFADCTALQTVVLPENLEKIGANAFYGCTALQEIHIPDSVTAIDDYAFKNCSALTELVLPVSLETLGNRFLEDCTGVKEIVIPKGFSGYSDFIELVASGSTSTAFQLANGEIAPFAGSSVETVTFENGSKRVGAGLFYGAEALKHVILPDSMESIGDIAFWGCSNLTEIDIPDSVNSIGFAAFAETGLKTAVLPAMLTSLEEGVFYNCLSLQNVQLPQTLKSICDPPNYNGLEIRFGFGTFEGCTSLTQIDIPSSVELIGVGAFSDCTALTAVVLPDSLTQIEAGAFHGAGLTLVSIPASVTSIGTSAFEDCSALTDVQLGEGITELSDSMFAGCTSLTTIDLPDSLTTIGPSAFENCSSLASISMPAGVISIGEMAFQGSALKQVVLPSALSVLNDYAFYDCANLEKVVFPDTLSKIGAYAFAGCIGLTALDIPDSVTIIGDHAFQNCTGFTQFTLPPNIREMGSYVFDGCTGIVEITIPASLTFAEDTFAGSSVKIARLADGFISIPAGLFSGNSTLEEVVLPSGMTEISDSMFADCTSLETVILPDGLQKIGDYAFSGCTSLQDIVLVPSITEIGAYVFENCSALQEMILPPNLVTMGREVFRGCTCITEITIPQSLTDATCTFQGSSIEKAYFEEGRTTTPRSIFAAAEALTTVILPQSLETITDYLCFECTSLTEVVLHNNITSIGVGAFSGCSSLESIDLPDSVQSIGYYAFHDCASLQNVHLPSNLKTLSEFTFYGCTSLKEITIPATLTTADSAFSGSGVETIYIADGSTAVPAGLFTGGSSIKKVVLPSTMIEIPDNMFEDCTSLETVVLPNGLQSIGAYAFSGCTSLKEIVLPDSVVSIGDRAFENCTALTGLDLPPHLVTLGNAVLSGCTGVTEITIPASLTVNEDIVFTDDLETDDISNPDIDFCFAESYVDTVYFEAGRTEIPPAILAECYTVKKVVLPDEIKKIGTYAFCSCRYLNDINIPNTVTEIGKQSFHGTGYYSAYYTDQFLTIELPPGLKKIGIGAFYSSGLKGITLPEGLETIGAYTFCTSLFLEKVVLPSTLKEIENAAFAECLALNDIKIPDGVTSIGEYAFLRSSIASIDIPDSVTSLGASVFDGCHNLTDAQIGTGITELPDSVFADCTSLANVTLPDGLVTIGPSAFEECAALAGIEIPQSVTSIGTMAFAGTGLQSVALPLNLSVLNDYTFYQCAFLEQVTLPETLTKIGAYAFADCEKLTEIDVPDSVTIMGNSAFQNCSALSKVELPAQLKQLGSYVFSGCSGVMKITVPATLTSAQNAFAGSSIETVTMADGFTTVPDNAAYYLGCAQTVKCVIMPDTVTTIGEHAFTDCINLQTVELSESLTHIGRFAFQGCSALAEIDFPESLTFIGVFAFDGCSSIQEIVLPSHIQTIEHCAFAGTQIESVTIPSSVEKFYSIYEASSEYESAFSGALKLTEVVFDDGRTNISARALSGCSQVTNVVIPSSVTSISSDAFAGCTGLQNVTYMGAEDQWDEITIESGNEALTNATIHYAHTHAYGEWIVDQEPTCTQEGSRHRVCTGCGRIEYGVMEMIPHSYTQKVVPPTYFEQGYTIYTCSVCGHTYRGDYVDPLERVDLSEAKLSLEYTFAYYEGAPLMPDVVLTYDGETYDAVTELKVTYTNNDQVGTATVTVEGINKFKGTVELHFVIDYETVPDQIVNVLAIGEVGKVSLSWGQSSEVTTDSYNIYRKASDETDFQLLKTVKGRKNLSFEDTDVEEGKTYFYYVTGVGLYGAESVPSEFASATVQFDMQAPVILKVSPASSSVLAGKSTLSAVVSDNVGVAKVVYSYSTDNGSSWLEIGETTNSAFSLVFDTSSLEVQSVQVKAVAYDAEGNASDPYTVVYSLDNIGPEKVTGVSAVAVLSSKITLAWNDVTANDAASFILQMQKDEAWVTIAQNITTLGYTVTGLQADTDYIYRVACVDVRGNIGEYSDEFTVHTAVDESAPVITSQSPAAARFNRAIAFSATAKDDCGIEKIEVQLSTDLQQWQTISQQTYTSASSQQTYRYTIPLLFYAEGSLYVRAVATDFSGNVSDTSDTAPYTEYIVDKTAPAAPKDVAANGSDGYITISWSMGTESDLGKYFVYRSSSANGDFEQIASNLSTLNYHDRNVERDGVYYYKVKVSDSCGNMSDFSAFVSAAMAADTQSPEITSISSTYQQKISNSAHTIRVAATDNNKLSQIVVEYCTSKNLDYVQLVSEQNIDNYYKSISVTLPLDGLEDGDILYLRAYAVDMAGLKSNYATAQYTVDNTPPAAKDFTAQLDGATVYLDWSDNGETDLSGFRVYRSTDGEHFTLLGSRGSNSTGSYSFVDTITDQTSNTYIYKLESIDRLGNTASWLQTVEYTYVYINQAPVAQMRIPDYMALDVEETFDASASTDDMAIVSYLWDFGDGTTSTEVCPVKSYDAVGTYTVKLSVTDNEGVTSVISKEIEVKEREMLGTLNVRVLDDSGKTLSYVPVYFDLGSDNQKIIYTDASGTATLQMLSGTHVIGMYASGYLPVKKDVVVLANASRTVTLTTVEEEIVTGGFEITRMTFDEIVAAGIDVYDPANQNVYSAKVQVTYGSSPPLTINYVRNDDEILDYTVTDSNGEPVKNYTNSNGENRVIAGVTLIPNGQGTQGDSDVVAIMDIPAEASYLKEFFDVRLHIINNASSAFSLDMNEVVLHVPNGMTLMDSVSGDYSTSNVVHVASIKGQETATISWVLRGDKAGEYNLSADFTGTLSEFDELVTAHFETEEPIKVYGLEGVTFRILTADEIHNDTLYFNIELENERDIDIYMPSIGITDKIDNITESVLNDNAADDFSADAYILNAYIQSDGGQKQYLAVTYDANGRATTSIDTLAPGQKIVYEYVAYNAINYDGVAYFKDAAVQEFEGIIENIETGSFHKELYSFVDYSEKLDAILSKTETDVTKAKDYILTEDNYYYHAEAADKENGILRGLYTAADVVLNADLSHFTQSEKKELIRSTILSILSDSSVVEQADDLVMVQYNKAVTEMINVVKTGTINKYLGGNITADKVASVFADIAKNSKSLAVTYMTDGSDAFKQELSDMVAKSALGLAIDASTMLTFKDEANIFSKLFGQAKNTIFAFLNAAEETERDLYYYSVLKMQCNADVSNHILDAIISITSKDFQDRYEEADLVHDIAESLKHDLNTNMDEYYESMNYAVNLLEEGAEVAAKAAIKLVVKKLVGTTPLGLVVKLITIGFNLLNSIFGFDNYYKQQDSMCVYDALTATFVTSFNNNTSSRNEDDDYYSMLYLRAACELRLAGEMQFKDFMQEYVDGVYGKPLSENEVMNKINPVKNTSYTSIDEWYDDLQYNIVHSRDILFNVEGITPVEIPRAPVVTLDYELLQTVQSFSSDYEYCFADGVWKTCNDEPISFTVGDTPSTLRVRKAAGFDSLAGAITTVRIYARKDLSKQISAKFDGISYWIDNLSSDYNYQIVFLNSLDETVDWATARTIAGGDSSVQVNGAVEHTYIAIRSCTNAAKYETMSNPLYLTVSKKIPLNLIIDGSGSVAQSSASGCYFVGDSVDLIADANTGCDFIGWYVNGSCVSTSAHYIVEMTNNLEVTAKFSGVKIKGISIDGGPDKLIYREGEPLSTNGLKVRVTYTDDSFDYIENYSAYIVSGIAGQSSVVVTYGGFKTSYEITIVHDESDWVTTQSATLFNEGLRVKRCSACGQITETEVIPMLQDLSGIQVDPNARIIYNIPESLFSSNAIISHYSDLGCNIKVLDSDENVASCVMTGGYIVYAGIPYSAVISGDTTGDGEIDVFDTLKMVDYANGKANLEGVYKLAGLIVNEEEIDIFDVLALIEQINGKANVNA